MKTFEDLKVLQPYKEAKRASDIINLLRDKEKYYLSLLYEGKTRQVPDLRLIYAAKSELLNEILFEVASLPFYQEAAEEPKEVKKID